MVRFSRKTKEQYVMTEVNGKATGWTAITTTENGGEPAQGEESLMATPLTA